MLGAREGLEPVVRATGARPVDVRRAAALALGRLTAPTDRDAIRALMRAIGAESDLLTRCYATVSLGRTGSMHGITPLADVLEHPNVALRGFGALGLGLLGQRSDDDAVRDRILRGLRTHLAKRGTPRGARAAVATAIGILGDERGGSVLLPLLEDKDPLLRGHAAVALSLLGTREAIPRLRTMLKKERDYWVIDRVATALGVLADGPSMKILEEMAREGSGEWRRAIAALALGRVGGPQAVRTLIEVVSEKDAASLVRSTASEALGRRLNNRPLRGFFALSEDFDYMLRLPAFHILLTLFD
jgi:HEAT repeat protein